MVKQAKVAFLTWVRVSKVVFVIDWPWTVIWRFLDLSLVISPELSFFQKILSSELDTDISSTWLRVSWLVRNAFVRNIRKQAKKKKRREEELGYLAVSVSPFIRKARCQLPKNGLWWSQNSTIRTGNSARHIKGRKIEWLALSFSKKAISNVGKKGK